MITQYEHHAAIRKHKLCPFFLRVGNRQRDTVCNWHKNPEFFLITGGKGHIRCGANDYDLTAGDLVVVNSGRLHRIYSKTGIDYLCLIVDEQFCRENGLNIAETVLEENFCDSETERLFLEATALLKHGTEHLSPTKTARVRCAVLQLLIDLFECHPATAPAVEHQRNAPDARIKEVLSYLNDHYTESLTLDEIAHAVGLSKYHLAREFKKHTDQTIVTYLNTLRCKNAEQCIRDGMTVTQAALDNGFETLSYFSRTYKQLMGRSPSQIRESPKSNTKELS